VASRLAWVVACAAFAASAASCAALLDLPAPTLDDGGNATVDSSPPLPDSNDAPSMDTSLSVDSTPDRFTEDTAPDTTLDSIAPADVAAETNNSDAGGVLCGLSPSNQCDPTSASPYCCETLNDAGTPVFGCVASESACASPKYFIQCANENDCPGNPGVCCHYGSHMICENSSSCSGGSVVQACDHSNPNSNECPTNQSCSMALTNLGAASPYWGCN
jgi:hypothetical protein